MYDARVVSSSDPVPAPRRRISIGFADGLLGGGLPLGMLTAIFGREGSGKSTLTLGMACAAPVTTVYATANAEMDPHDVLRLAHRTGADVHGLVLARVDTVADAIDAAMDYRAELLVLDSLNAASDFHVSKIRIGIDQLQRWVREENRAALVAAMYDTAGRRAGGMAVAYRPDNMIDLIAPGEQRFAAYVAALMSKLDGEQAADLDIGSLRFLSVHKGRCCNTDAPAILRMTASGMQPHEFELDAALRRMVEADESTGGDGRSASLQNPTGGPS